MSSIGGGSSLSRKKNKSEANAQDERLEVPVLQVGDEVPNFTCDSTMGLFNLHDVIDGSFAVFVTFLYGFDPVATTEIGMLSKLKEEFAARDVKLVALCVDTKENHRKWIEDIQELQDCEVWFPIIADYNAEFSRLLNLVKPKVDLGGRMTGGVESHSHFFCTLPGRECEAQPAPRHPCDDNGH